MAGCPSRCRDGLVKLIQSIQRLLTGTLAKGKSAPCGAFALGQRLHRGERSLESPGLRYASEPLTVNNAAEDPTWGPAPSRGPRARSTSSDQQGAPEVEQRERQILTQTRNRTVKPPEAMQMLIFRPRRRPQQKFEGDAENSRGALRYAWMRTCERARSHPATSTRAEEGVEEESLQEEEVEEVEEERLQEEGVEEERLQEEEVEEVEGERLQEEEVEKERLQEEEVEEERLQEEEVEKERLQEEEVEEERLQEEEVEEERLQEEGAEEERLQEEEERLQE
ncbi:unnamed protein product [Boreogadus saida]